MDGPITRLVWVTRETTTARHVEGLAGLLAELGALSHAQLRIVIVPEGGRAILPPGSWVDPGDGTISTESAEFTDHALPPEGILVVAPPV